MKNGTIAMIVMTIVCLALAAYGLLREVEPLRSDVAKVFGLLAVGPAIGACMFGREWRKGR